MKRVIYIIIALAILAFCAWLFSRQPAKTLTPNVAPKTNSIVTPIISNTPPPKPVPLPVLATNTLIRPDYIDEEHWNELMLARQLVLSQNQPVEFYARVLDQNDQPVEGAKLLLKLTRADEKMFATTNFFSRQMGDEVLTIPFELQSDSTGWIRFTGTNGYFLDLWSLKKEGYLFPLPEGNFAGAHYQPNGIRTPTEDILMTNSWNPDAGYILHLQKIQNTNSAK